MEATEMYKDRAVIFDPNGYPDGWDNPYTINDFISTAIQECDGFLPDDWYVDMEDTTMVDDDRFIVVKLQRYEDGQNLQTFWVFKLNADPVDDLDNQWIVFDVLRLDAHKMYRFQMP